MRFVDGNKNEIGSRDIQINISGKLIDLRNKLKSNNRGFKYKNEVLYLEIDPNTPQNDIKLSNNGSLKSQGLEYSMSIIYFQRK